MGAYDRYERWWWLLYHGSENPIKLWREASELDSRLGGLAKRIKELEAQNLLASQRVLELTRETLILAFEHIGYKVTDQGAGGLRGLLRLPDGTPTEYWVFADHMEHSLAGFHGGTYLSYKDCVLKADDATVAIVSKNTPGNGVFIQFHNFKDHG